MREARFRRLAKTLDRRQSDLTVLMERVHKSHNFSAILRNCDAAGVFRVHAIPPLDGLPLHRSSSSGAHKWVRVKRHPDTASAVAALKAHGLRLIAAHPGEQAADFRAVDYTQPTALLLGSELDGLSEEALSLADQTVAIPMYGMVRSFNVSVASALLLYEAVRQRAAAGMYETPDIGDEDRARVLFEWSYPRLARKLRDLGVSYPKQDETGALVDSEGLAALKG